VNVEWLTVGEAGVVGHQDCEEVAELCYWEYGIPVGLMLFGWGI
jgi:hypothetical protein